MRVHDAPISVFTIERFPQRGLAPLASSALRSDKPLCAKLGGFSLHVATHAGALDGKGREALLRYVLRPPLAQERLEVRPDGLVRTAPKRAYADGTSLSTWMRCRSSLATSVPPSRFHTVKYAGVLAPASAWRARIAPRAKAAQAPDETTNATAAEPPKRALGQVA